MDIKISHISEIKSKSRLNAGDIIGYQGSNSRLLVVGEDNIYVHSFVIGTGQYYGISKIRPENVRCVTVFEKSHKADAGFGRLTLNSCNHKWQSFGGGQWHQCEYCGVNPSAEITRLQSELTAARDEAERLRGRVTSLEYHATRMLKAIKADDIALGGKAQDAANKLLFDSTEDYMLFREDGDKAPAAWLLRKQAEAVDSLTEEMDKVVEGRQAIGAVASSWIKERSKSLRQQADELERLDGRP